MCTAPEPPLQAGEAVLTLRDMTSDAQTPLAHATMLCDTSGFQWHVACVTKTCDMSMDAIGTCQKPVKRDRARLNEPHWTRE